MTVRNLAYALKPKSVAVIGASPRPGSVGAVVLENIVAGGFQGPIYPVNPNHASIGGLTAYPDIGALPTAPDLAVIATPPDTVAPLVAALGARGCKAAAVLTAGFGEGGTAQGEARRQALLDAARPHLFRLIGPNCFGLMVPGCGLNASFARLPAEKGHLAFISQSGALVAAMLDWAKPRAIGFSHVVTVGDMADVDFGDLLDYLCKDPDTHAILLYVEAVTHARKFMSAARAAARIKPVLVVKGGRQSAGAKVAASHTGALAGSDPVYNAAFARAGVLRVDDVADLFAAAALLTSGPLPQGDRLAIVTNGGGFGVLATDTLIGSGGRLAALSPETLARLDGCLPPTWSHANPVDIIGDANGVRDHDAMAAVIADPNVDAVLAMLCPTAIADPLEAATAVADVAAQHPERPILTAWLGDASVGTSRAHFMARHIPTFETPTEAVMGFLNLVRYAKRRDLLLETPPSSAEIAPENVAAARALVEKTAPGWMAAPDVKRLLALYDIPCNRTVLAADGAAAAEVAQAWNVPVALKIFSPDVLHKSDVGGVALNLEGPAAVRAEADAMLARVRRHIPDARIEGFIVEEMVRRPGAQELILGIARDVTFGPVIAFGHGGTAVEVINDKSLGLPPLNLKLARAMIAETRVGRLLEGYRNQPPAKIDAVASALLSLSQLVIDNPSIAELDINPLLADENGIVAVDARIKIDPASAPLVISPYPRELSKTLTLPKGDSVFMRPIRPQDEPALRAFIKSLDPQDIRFRFFAPMNEMSHGMAARLTQIDYDREMALVVFKDEKSEDALWGVARFFADPDNRQAEFAIVVQSHQRSLGLGMALMNEVIALARRRGIGAFWGDVMSENRRMLDLCERLGMKRSASPVGPDIVRMTLALKPD